MPPHDFALVTMSVRNNVVEDVEAVTAASHTLTTATGRPWSRFPCGTCVLLGPQDMSPNTSTTYLEVRHLATARYASSSARARRRQRLRLAVLPGVAALNLTNDTDGGKETPATYRTTLAVPFVAIITTIAARKATPPREPQSAARRMKEPATSYLESP